MDSDEEETTNKVHPYPGSRRKSRVWDYFGFFKKPDSTGPPTLIENLDMRTCICKLCGRKYANKGNTTNMQRHLDDEHRSQMTTGACEKPKVLKQTKIDALPQSRLPNTKQKELDDALYKLLVGKVLPLSLVDHPLFRNFVNLLEPRYKVPSRKTVVSELQTKYNEVKAKVKEDVSSCTSLAITHDGWTSLNTESYESVTAHFITSSWDLRTVVLETCKVEGRHTGENIAETLRGIQSSWELPSQPQQLVAVTDNAANEQKAFKILGWLRFGCYGHRINLVVKSALAIAEVAKLVDKGRKLVSFFHRSTSATDVLKVKQKLLLSESAVGHKLQIDCPTRWNSCLQMLRRLVEQTPAICAMVNDPQVAKAAVNTIRNCAYSLEEHATIEKMIEVLSPFEKATLLVSSEVTPTMQNILPVVLKIGRCLEDSDGDPPIILDMKAVLRMELERRSSDRDLALAACVLNPHTKNLHFLSQNERQEGHQWLLEKVQDIVSKKKTNDATTESVSNMQPEKSDQEDDVEIMEISEKNSSPRPGTSIPSGPSDAPCVKKAKVSHHVDEWLHDVVAADSGQNADHNTAESEVNAYLQSPLHDKAPDDSGETDDLTILDWWKANEARYPNIAELARQYLAVPASSVPSERIFSLAGSVVSKKRARLNASNVNMFVFLNKNMKHYW